MTDDVLARRIEAGVEWSAENPEEVVGFGAEIFYVSLSEDGVRGLLERTDHDLRKAGQRVWWCEAFGNPAGAWENADGTEGPCAACEGEGGDGCGWVYVIPATALAGEDDQ